MVLCPSISFSGGAEVASRYNVRIENASSIVLGNGRLGVVLPAARDSLTFLEGTVTGEHWIYETGGVEKAARPNRRATLAAFRIDTTVRRQGRGSPHRMMEGASYRLFDGILTNHWSSQGFPVSATCFVSPASTDFRLTVTSLLPVAASMTLVIPEEEAARDMVLSCTPEPTPGGNGILLGLTRNLPEEESYGMALVVGGTTERIRKLPRGWSVRLKPTRSWFVEIVLVEPPERGSLARRTLEISRRVAERGGRRFYEESQRWWREFWNRSALDFSGSEDSLAREVEKVWVTVNHALAVHARGTFPPGDSGFWNSHGGGRIWHPTLWSVYRGWIFSNHAEDIRCYAYPLAMVSSEDPGALDRARTPLLPVESGPNGVAAAPEEKDLLENVWQEVFGTTRSLEDELRSRCFSSIPYLAFYSHRFAPSDTGVDSVYPFLRDNANRASVVLNRQADCLAEDEKKHLLAAVWVARRFATRLHIDEPSCRFWTEVLEKHPHSEVLGFHHGLPVRKVERDLSSVHSLRWTSEGLLVTRQGFPTLLGTGVVLTGLLEAVVFERKGVLELFPGIPQVGAWCVRVEGVGTSSGFVLEKLSMKNGVVDSFLLKSLEGGDCRLRLPHGWRGAQVVEIGETHRNVEVRRAEPATGGVQRVIAFETAPGSEFLIGPVW